MTATSIQPQRFQLETKMFENFHYYHSWKIFCGKEMFGIQL